MRKRDEPLHIPDNSNFVEWSGGPGTFTFRLLPAMLAARHTPDIQFAAVEAAAAAKALQAADSEAEQLAVFSDFQTKNETFQTYMGFLVMLMWRDRTYELETRGRYRSKWYVDNADGDPREAAGHDAFEELFDFGFSDAEFNDLARKLWAAQNEATTREGASTGVDSHLRFFGKASRGTGTT